MKKEEMFNRLVENALDFLVKARLELEKQPKYSVIHFHAAVELFLKSRLMHEHWSLIVSKRQDPDWNKFVRGDFVSVSLKQAADRLDKVVQSAPSEEKMEAFYVIAKHRNEMIHFFHTASSEEESNELIRNIVRQQLRAWYFLHQLLTIQWKKVFASWKTKIKEIDTALRELHEFLQVVFDSLQQEIASLKAEGVRFDQCPSCGFHAQQHIEDVKILYKSECLVCRLIEECINIQCPDCNELITFRNEGFATCTQCGKSMEPEDLADELIDSGGAYIAFTDGGYPYQGNCSDCDGHQTVVCTENDDWICASCFEVFDTLEECEWCNELNTGDMEHSYLTGCNHCEGKIGWDWDKDD